MPDRMTIEQRHNNMAAIKGKDTKPEILVRKFLWARGFRYRLNHPRLPGKPDIVLRKYRTCILVNGCFWHGHEGCRYYVMPKSNTQFWQNKIRRNRERDHEVLHRLAEMGWHTIVIWECDYKPWTGDCRGLCTFYYHSAGGRRKSTGNCRICSIQSIEDIPEKEKRWIKPRFLCEKH